MMTRHRAEQLVQSELAERARGAGGEDYVILGDQTLERPWGWVFFWDSRGHLESGDPGSMLLGNLPYLVNRFTSTIEQYRVAPPVDWHIARYELCLERRGRRWLGPARLQVFRLGGSAFRPSRCALVWGAPGLVLIAVATTVLLCNGDAPAGAAAVVLFVDALAFLLLFGLWDAYRFWWAWRMVTGAIAVLASSNVLWPMLGPASVTTALDWMPALIGFFVIGVPCFWHTLFGRFPAPRSSNRSARRT